MTQRKRLLIVSGSREGISPIVGHIKELYPNKDIYLADPLNGGLLLAMNPSNVEFEQTIYDLMHGSTEVRRLLRKYGKEGDIAYVTSDWRIDERIEPTRTAIKERKIKPVRFSYHHTRNPLEVFRDFFKEPTAAGD